MSLRSALLLLLTSGPMTGYAVTKRFAASVGNVWHAPDSQIYPELRRMEAEGLVRGEEVPWGTKGATKREYSITEEGVAEIRRWYSEPQAYARERDPARLRAAYFEWADADEAREHLQAHRDHYAHERDAAVAMIARIEANRHETLERRKERYAPQHRDRVQRWKTYAYRGSILRAEAEIAWADEGLALIGDDDALPYPDV